MNTKFLGKGVDKPHQVCYNKEKKERGRYYDNYKN